MRLLIFGLAFYTLRSPMFLRNLNLLFLALLVSGFSFGQNLNNQIPDPYSKEYAELKESGALDHLQHPGNQQNNQFSNFDMSKFPAQQTLVSPFNHQANQNYQANRAEHAEYNLANMGQGNDHGALTPPPPPPPPANDCGCYEPHDPSWTLAMGPNDDGSTGLIPLPFTFCFYGQNINGLYINNNGNVSFGASYGTFTAVAFPTATFQMIAPFWGDVDTRGGLGQVWYKITPTSIRVNWENVGYYSQNGDKRNTFSVILTNGADPVLTPGNNVAFCYGNMAWTTGEASCGVNNPCTYNGNSYSCNNNGGLGYGYCGSPATVGANRGNGVGYVQFGQYNHPGIDYDGPFNQPDGVDWLDTRSLVFNVCNGTNLPPIQVGLDLCDTGSVCVGDTLIWDVDFLGPEATQNVTVTVTAPGVAGFSIISITNGQTANAVVQLVASQLNVGLNHIIFNATDNGVPVQSVDFHLYVWVNDIAQYPVITGDTLACRADSLLLTVTPAGFDSTVWQTGLNNVNFWTQDSVNVVTAYLGGCVARDTHRIIISNMLLTPSSTDVNCPNDSTGTATVTPTNGIPPYLYAWNTVPPQITQTAVGLPAGTFECIVTDSLGCEDTLQVTINVNVNPAILPNLGPDTSFCDGGSVVLDPGVPAATGWLWNTGAVTPTLTVSTSGTYWVEVDVSGCTFSDTIVVVVWPNPTPFLGNDTSLCDGQPLLLDATTPGATYLWQDNTTGATLSPTLTGTYGVTVTDANGCTGTDSIDITFIPIPVVNLGPDITLCDGATYLLDATAPGATYLWQDNTTAATYTVTGAGNYQVWVTINGCTGTDDVDFFYNPNPTPNLGPDLDICLGTNAVLDATTPGATYLWNDGTTGPTLTTGVTGTYWVEVNLAGCLGFDTVNVTTYASPTVNLGPDQFLCEGDLVLLDATHPDPTVTYLWQDNTTAPTLQADSTGLYIVQLLTPFCPAVIDSIDLVFYPIPVVNLGPDLDICQGTIVALDVTTPGGTYLWNTGFTGGLLNVSTTGTYFVEVTVNNCTGFDTVNITVYTPPTVNLGPDQFLCEGDVVLLDATHPDPTVTYQWQDNTILPTFLANVTGTYYVQLFTPFCPVVIDSVNLTFYPIPVVNLGPDLNICQGTVAQLDATAAGATYLWNDGSTGPVLNTTLPGTYWVEVTINNCTGYDTITVNVYDPPTANLGPDQFLCEGDIVLLDATSPDPTVSYLWQDNSTLPTLWATLTGTYTVQLITPYCPIVFESIDLTFYPIPVVNLGPDQQICQGAVAILDATAPGASYLWNDGSTGPTLNATTTGIYSVAVTINNCTGYDTVQIDVFPPPIVNLGADLDLCDGQTRLLDATSLDPNATYLWQDGTTTPTYLVTGTGTYTVTVTTTACPSETGSVTMTYHPHPVVDLGADTAICPGEMIVLDAFQPGATYTWQDNSTAATYLVTTAGGYYVTVSNGYCTGNDFIHVSHIALPYVDLGNDSTICPGDQITLNAWYPGFPGPVYLWQDSSSSMSYNVTLPGVYHITVSNECGTDRDTIEFIQPPNCVCNIYVPNAFSPNGDGLNEDFKPTSECIFMDYNFQIFNRWGALVFESNDPNTGWDGRYRDKIAQSDAYVWLLTYRADKNGKIFSEKVSGTVIVIR